MDQRRFKLLLYSRILLSNLWLSENQPQGSFFGSCKIGSNEQPNMGGQLPNYILYREFRDLSVDFRKILRLKIDGNTKLFADL
jgi:hypothetical protein